jgi:hypothetical protein
MASTRRSEGRPRPGALGHGDSMTPAIDQASLSTRSIRLRRHVSAASRDWLTPHHIAIVAVLGAALIFYMWTANSAAPFRFSSQNSDVYNDLTTAFLHGHTYLPMTPPPGLLHLSNPYDPAQNAPYQAAYHDLSLRNGHFYSPWGPTPALTLFLPFRLTTLKMSESFAVFLFAFIGLACAVALLHMLARRLLPETPRWLLVLASAALALTNVAPFMLRRPAQYEVAISAGYCFEMAGILLIVSALGSPLRRRRLALGSLCLGLAVGARISLLPGGAVALAAAVYLIRRRNERYNVLLPALGPFLLCGLLLVVYNVVRFGSVSDFGTAYELAGLNPMTLPPNQLSYLPPGLFSYLLMPPRLALTFPHFFLMSTAQYPFPFPRDYAGAPGGWPAEPAGGLLTTMPITLLLLAIPVLWWRRPKTAERPALLVATGLVALGLTIIVVLSIALWGTTQRYEVDYASLVLIPAFLVWAILTVRWASRKIARRCIVFGGIALTCFGAAVGTAVSFTGYYDTLRLTHPGLFRTFEDLTSPLATLATMVSGKVEIASVSGPLPVALPPVGYGTFDENGAGTWVGAAGPVTVAVLAPSGEHLALIAAARRGPGAPSKQPVALRVQSPGGKALTVPIVGASVRLPIRLHWGLNRIEVSLAGELGTSPEGLYIDNLQLSH